ncbi:WD repeat-containing protein 89 [Bufo gargarizans]|uniref:WD repeat-containing protein 89 n=1 Tax=Bufo gargarizans TaxID=30331 RepID=UPI001CF2E58F|nr:WD repeat-containing protein 89 [Bufo gargarizans]
MEALAEELSHLNLARRSAMKDSTTYILDIDVSKSVEEQNGQTVAILCSDNTIRLYNKETMACLHEYNARPTMLSGVRFSHTNSNLVFSACSDATVKLWDARVSGTDAVQQYTGYPSNVFISFDVCSNDLVVCAGTEKVGDDVYLVFWDGRYTPDTEPKEPLGAYSESHNDDITQVRFHPTNPSLVATGSTDGLVNVFDLNEDNEDDALTSTCNSESSVNIIGWAGRDDKQVYCLTHSEGFLWWDLNQVDTEEPITLCKVEDMREHVSGCHIDYLIAGFYNRGRDALLLLGGTQDGDISLLNCNFEKVTHLKTLTGGHSTIVRSVYWCGDDDSLISGGEDAQLLLWKPKVKDMSPKKRDSMKAASSVQQRVRMHNTKSFLTKQK